jgi:hypothetical protein
MLHNLAFKIARLEPEQEALSSLDDSLIKILEKRVPKIAQFAENSPEITYLTTWAFILMTAPKGEYIEVKEKKTDDTNSND